MRKPIHPSAKANGLLGKKDKRCHYCGRQPDTRGTTKFRFKKAGPMHNIVEIRNYGTGSSLGFPMGNAVGAMHIKRDYTGQMTMSFAARAALKTGGG